MERKALLTMLFAILLVAMVIPTTVLAAPIIQTTQASSNTMIKVNDSALVDSQVVNTMKMTLEKNTDAIRDFQVVNSAFTSAHISKIMDQIGVMAMFSPARNVNSSTSEDQVKWKSMVVMVDTSSAIYTGSTVVIGDGFAGTIKNTVDKMAVQKMVATANFTGFAAAA
jgi:hypothetical protein